MMQSTDMSPDDDDAERDRIEADVRRWLERAVIGLNLCPFAKRCTPRARCGSWSATRAPSAHCCSSWARKWRLRDTPAETIDTTLLVHPQVLGDFLDYNDFLDDADALVEAMDLDGVLQVASFHPHYQFAGTQPDDAENLTNRAPYPILHLLREDSVDRAVAALPGAGRDRPNATWRRCARSRRGLRETTRRRDSRARSASPRDLPLAFRQAVERQPADAFAVQRDDVVADRGEHPPRLVVAAFVQGQARVARVDEFEPGRQQRRFSPSSISVPLANSAVRRRAGPARAWRDRPSALRFRRDDPVQQLAVVGEQQQAGGVPVQPPDRGQRRIAQAESRRQQSYDAPGILARTGDAGRLVERQQQALRRIQRFAVDAPLRAAPRRPRTAPRRRRR